MSFRIDIYGIPYENYVAAIFPYHFSPHIEVFCHPEENVVYHYFSIKCNDPRFIDTCKHRSFYLMKLMCSNNEDLKTFLNEETVTGIHIRQCKSCEEVIVKYSTDALVLAYIRSRCHFDLYYNH